MVYWVCVYRNRRRNQCIAAQKIKYKLLFLFIHLPPTQFLSYSATNRPTEMADHFSWSTQSWDYENVTHKFLSLLNPICYFRQRNTIHKVIKFCCFFFLTDRLLFDASMRNKKNYGLWFFLCFPDLPTAQNGLVKVTINTE